MIEEKDESIKEHIRDIVRPIFDKVAEEAKKNPMMVGQGRSVSYYIPHNYRRYFFFDKTGFCLEPYLKGMVDCDHKMVNHGKEHSFRIFGCRITIRKSMVEVINQIDSNKAYPIELYPIDKIMNQFVDIIVRKDQECISALKRFIGVFGGSSDLKIASSRSEDKVFYERAIDALPLKMKFHNEVVKKVYDEKNIEFSNPVFASNYFTNRGVENIAPEIANELKGIRLFLDNDLLLESLKDKIKCLNDVYSFTDDIRHLSLSNRIDLSHWLHSNFGLSANKEMTVD